MAYEIDEATAARKSVEDAVRTNLNTGSFIRIGDVIVNRGAVISIVKVDDDNVSIHFANEEFVRAHARFEEIMDNLY